MGNEKIPKGYQGHYMKNSNGGHTLVMVSKVVDDTPKKSTKGVEAVSKSTAKTEAPKPTVAAQPAPPPTATERPKGRDFSPSDRMKYHGEEADKAFGEGKFVKGSNHLAGYRQAQKELRERAVFKKKNPDYVRKADRT